MSKASGRLHATGGSLFILAGITHGIGQFAPGPQDPGSAAVEKSMRGFVLPGTSFTYWNIMQCWGALYGGMTLLLGVLLLVAVRAAGGAPRVLRACTIVGASAAILQCIAAIAFDTLPPVFFMAPAALCFLLAVALSKRDSQ